MRIEDKTVFHVFCLFIIVMLSKWRLSPEFPIQHYTLSHLGNNRDVSAYSRGRCCRSRTCVFSPSIKKEHRDLVAHVYNVILDWPHPFAVLVFSFIVLKENADLPQFVFHGGKSPSKWQSIGSCLYRWCDKCLFTINPRDWFIDTLEWTTALVYGSLQGLCNVAVVLKAHVYII